MKEIKEVKSTKETGKFILKKKIKEDFIDRLNENQGILGLILILSGMIVTSRTIYSILIGLVMLGVGMYKIVTYVQSID